MYGYNPDSGSGQVKRGPGRRPVAVTSGRRKIYLNDPVDRGSTVQAAWERVGDSLRVAMGMEPQFRKRG